MRDIPLLDPEYDRTHDARGDPMWQESSLIVWHDLAGGSGGFWRLSQEPVNALVHSTFAVFTPDGMRFRNSVQSVPMGPADRGPTHMALGQQLRLDLDTLTITAKFPDCEASLRFEDFHPRYDFLTLMKLGHPEGHGGAHLEVGGRVTGHMKVGGKQYQVDALAHRDRSWGPRDWGTMLCTRWWPMVFGPDLCCFVMGHLHKSGEHGVMGYVIRDGIPILMTEADPAVTLDYDAVGVRAAQSRCVLETGETFDLVHHRTSGAILDVKGFFAVESIGTATWGDRIGMSNIEVYTNAFGGTRMPTFVLEADNSQGLSRRHG